MNRGLRNLEGAAFAQDEWRVTPRFTWNYGVRYEIGTPFVDIRDRMNAWAPGRQSQVYPDAPRGLLFPGDPGVPRGIAPVFRKAVMPRVGFAFDPAGDGKSSIRAAYGVFFDSFTNGVGGPLQAPLSALPWTQARQLSAPINYPNPWNGRNPFQDGSFPQPTTVLTVENGMRPPYSQNWNFSLQRALGAGYLLDARYIGNKGTRLPRMLEANPALFGPEPPPTTPTAAAPTPIASESPAPAISPPSASSPIRPTPPTMPRRLRSPGASAAASLSSRLTISPRLSITFPASTSRAQLPASSVARTTWPRIPPTFGLSTDPLSSTPATASFGAAVTKSPCCPLSPALGGFCSAAGSSTEYSTWLPARPLPSTTAPTFRCRVARRRSLASFPAAPMRSPIPMTAALARSVGEPLRLPPP